MLPVIPEWTDTRVGLHQAAQVIGAIRATVAAPQPNWTHLGLCVVPEGLTTGDLPSLGEFVLSFANMTIVYRSLDQDPVGFSLVQHTQQTLMDAITGALAGMGHEYSFKRDKLTAETVFKIDPKFAGIYARALHIIDGAIKQFRESLPGQTSPAIVWPHGFDLSCLWFATDEASETKPYMAFGFSPYSSGFERPYLYVYAHPVPGGLTDLDLPDHTHWHTGDWTGAVLRYDNLIGRENPAAIIVRTFRTIFENVSPLLR